MPVRIKKKKKEEKKKKLERRARCHTRVIPALGEKDKWLSFELLLG